MKTLIFILILCANATVNAQLNNAEQLIATAMKIWPDSFGAKLGERARWSYDQVVVLKGVEGAWKLTGNGTYFNYIQHCIDLYVRDDGSFYDYKPNEFNIDHINNGKLLLLLYKVTGKEKYKKAVDLLRSSLKSQPLTTDGIFWDKKIYSSQMWHDGLYMSEPFYAEYAATFHEDAAFNDITRQFVLMEQHARAMGWYGSAMVDVLDHFPANHLGRDSIIKILNRFAKTVAENQDKTNGLWLANLDNPKESKNYFDASASSMFVYSLLKGVRKGYLPKSMIAVAKNGYDGIVSKFIKVEGGQMNLYGNMSEPVVINDPKNMGAFIQCSIEMQLASINQKAIGKEVVVDRFYNNEWKKDITGKLVRWHYNWDEVSNSGFSFFGSLFEQQGAVLKCLDTAPSKSVLSQSSVYIIVDPDHLKDNPTPNFMNEKDAVEIADWVKKGGTLLMMANDSNNCDLLHFNILANKFGIHFTNKSINMVKGSEYETGAVYINKGNEIFRSGPKIHIKEISTLELTTPATVLVKKENDIVIATAKYGKGKVFAIGDPWLYNEYVDGRKLPAEWQNFTAAKELVQWLLTN